MTWTGAGTAITGAFLASFVEFVEAATIVLAVSVTRGWRAALAGTTIAVGLLVLLVVVFGPALSQVPFATLQLIIGILLLLFGMRWLRKAILRSAGVIGMHNETAIYARETAELRSEPGVAGAIDRLGMLTAFKAVTLEGLEVVFIVIATGANGTLLAASIGAAAAGVIVVALALMLRAPLARVPENTLKFSVGVLLSAFGVFWCGEGLGVEWPGGDLALLALIAGFLITSFIGIRLARRTPVAA